MTIKSILSVDDNDVDLMVHRRRILGHDAGIEVRDAADGQQALDALAEAGFWPDLIFLDVNMPVLDGFGFLDQAMALYGAGVPPVILTLTSVFQDRDTDRLEDYPPVLGCLVKPLTNQWFREVDGLFTEGDRR